MGADVVSGCERGAPEGASPQRAGAREGARGAADRADKSRAALVFGLSALRSRRRAVCLLAIIPSVCFQKIAGDDASRRRRSGLQLNRGRLQRLHRPVNVHTGCRMETFELQRRYIAQRRMAASCGAACCAASTPSAVCARTGASAAASLPAAVVLPPTPPRRRRPAPAAPPSNTRPCSPSGRSSEKPSYCSPSCTMCSDFRWRGR